MASEQLVADDVCESCKKVIGYDRDSCPDGHFADFPNIRYARKMRPALMEHYAQARRNADERAVQDEFDRLMRLLDGSAASINLELRVASNLASGQAYRTYQASVDAGQRTIAKREFHRVRTQVDAAVHTGYGHHIVNIALSPDGRGLPNYGPVTLLLREESVRDRCAALRENAFHFYDRFKLGDRGASEEAGWRSDWGDRSMLGAAALEPEIHPGISDSGLRQLILLAGQDRIADRFIELHLYDAVLREFVDRFYLDVSCLNSPASGTLDDEEGQRDADGLTAADRLCWRQIQEKLARSGATPIEQPHG